MKKLEILTDSNPILRKKSIKVVELTEDIKQLVLDMKKTMVNEKGIGLAAPQVGKNIRLIVINTENGSVALINPKIYKKSLLKCVEQEGCLSLPDIFGDVKRHKSIKITAIDEDDNKIDFKATGLMARVIQHEVDHLDGVLISDKFIDTKDE